MFVRIIYETSGSVVQSYDDLKTVGSIKGVDYGADPSPQVYNYFSEVSIDDDVSGVQLNSLRRLESLNNGSIYLDKLGGSRKIVLSGDGEIIVDHYVPNFLGDDDDYWISLDKIWTPNQAYSDEDVVAFFGSGFDRSHEYWRTDLKLEKSASGDGVWIALEVSFVEIGGKWYPKIESGVVKAARSSDVGVKYVDHILSRGISQELEDWRDSILKTPILIMGGKHCVEEWHNQYLIVDLAVEESDCKIIVVEGKHE